MQKKFLFIVIIPFVLLGTVLYEALFLDWPVCNQSSGPFGHIEWCTCLGAVLKYHYDPAYNNDYQGYCLGIILNKEDYIIEPGAWPIISPTLSPSPTPTPIPTPTPMPSPSPKEITFKTISQGQYSGFSEAKNYVITNTNDWQSLWNKVYGNVLSKPPLPEVDFNKSMVIAVSLGSKPTGGYDIKITGVKEREAEGLIAISVEESSPGKDCIVSQALTSPYHIIETDKTDKEVVFDTSQFADPCDLGPSF